jgi:hypothetical protein
MRMSGTTIIVPIDSIKLTRTLAKLLAVLLLVSAFAAGGTAALASDHDEDVSATATDIESSLDLFDRMEQAPGLYTEFQIVQEHIEFNLEAFNRMEQAPGLYTESPVARDRDDDILDLFDRMEQAPGLYTEFQNTPAPDSIESNLELFDMMEQHPGLFND